MKSFTVSDLMVPLSEYARHRAILVFGKDNKIVGKLSQVDVLRALEPKYNELMTDTTTRHFGFSTQYIKGMLEQFSLWASPLTDICRKGVDRKVKDFVYTPSPGEFVSLDASLDVAIHQQSLLVRDAKDDIVGILRLTDVFAAVFHKLKECKLDD